MNIIHLILCLSEINGMPTRIGNVFVTVEIEFNFYPIFTIGKMREFFQIFFITFAFSRKPKPSGRYWSGEMSARSNQDNQREYEERAMKQIISMVNKRTGNDSNGRHSFSQPIGGSFVRLEAEWREKHRQNKIKPNGNKF